MRSEQAIQLAVKAAPVRCDCAVGEIGPPVPDRAGILQERLELRCEDGVAVIDRVLRITDQMGEAELVRLGVCALGRQAIRQPHLRPHAGEKPKQIATIPIGSRIYWVTFRPDGKICYVSARGAGEVDAVDTETKKIVARMPVGKEPKRLIVVTLPTRN